MIRQILLVLSTLGLCLLDQSASAQAPADINLQPKNFRADLLIGRQVVSVYRFEKELAKPVFFPLNTPAGLPVTRSWPMSKNVPGESMDHPHQKSLWFCHGDVVAEGLTKKDKIRGVDGVDFWSKAPGHGRIECVDVGMVRDGKDGKQLDTKNAWRTADGTAILDERRIVTFVPVDADAYVLLFEIELAALKYPIVFADTKEGCLGTRVRESMRADKVGTGTIRNADGKKGEKEAWGQISRWCDYAGPVDGKAVGITMLAHEQNPYPSCWHVRGYGLMAANPFGRARSGFPPMKGKTDVVRLEAGKSMTLRYGVMVYDGERTPEQIDAVYKRYMTKAWE